MVSMINDELRPPATYPIYPPYHTGYYLEEYFYSKFNQSSSTRSYIDIFWTNLYCNKSNINIQHEVVTNLDWSKQYFTVCQHDDGPKEELPPDTLIFSAGGNRTSGNIIPIPLICSAIPSEFIQSAEKTLLGSFVGSCTHPIREKMYYTLIENPKFSIQMAEWSNTVPLDNFINFVNITSASKFTLCPRGYGLTSFRLYEAFQLNSVPVYISDRHYLPWADELNWNDFCVLITEPEIENIENILESISDDKYNKMLDNGRKVYKNYFTLDGITCNIIKRLT